MISVDLAERLTGVAISSHWWASGKVTAASTSVSTWIPVGAAVVAASAAIWSAFLQRKTGREATEAAARSALASQRSAKAAEDSVDLNRDIAAASGARADAVSLAQRYQDAASQLGHDKAAVRLAGVYAMSRLADDWPEERQTCIDVLCAYLRLPWQDPLGSAAASDELQVRRTVVSVINSHAAADAKISWADNDFDFTRAQLRDFLLEGCVFRGRVTFSGAEFVGECGLADIAFTGRATFDSCVVGSKTMLSEVGAGPSGNFTFAAALVRSGAELEIRPRTEDPEGIRWSNDFRNMKVQGKLKIMHVSSLFRQPPFNLDGMKLDGGCVQVVSTLTLTKDKRVRYPCPIWMRGWKISSGSEIDIPQHFIDDNTVQWGFALQKPDIPVDVKMSFHPSGAN